MVEENNNNSSYKLERGYSIEKISGAVCNMALKDAENKTVCFMEGCNNKITLVKPYQKRALKAYEKTMLHRFIIANHFLISHETADSLDLSILRYGDEDNEKYLSENQLKKVIKRRLDNVRIYIGKLRLHTLKIPAFSKGGVYNLSRAEITNLVIEENCDLLVDVRDNKSIESLRIRESFSGAVNLSRNSVQSVEIGDNCRCDLSMFDSIKCFNLTIGDVFSGSLNIKNSCFHALSIGYYCYAQLKLSDNWGRRDLTIGDSFRGNLKIDNINIYNINIGRDCKGQITVNSERISTQHNINIDDDFGGVLDVREDNAISALNVGEHAGGKFNFLGCEAIKAVNFGKYFSGYADFSESSIEYVQARYGCSGEMIFIGCENLNLLKLPRDRNSRLHLGKEPLSVENHSDASLYRFRDEPLSGSYFSPFYAKVVDGLKSLWH